VRKTPINRRDALRLVAVTAAGGTLMSSVAFAQEASADATTLMPGADVCVLTPEVTEGP
jgi:predicted ATPase